jgi:small subunit ribosomal protein S11
MSEKNEKRKITSAVVNIRATFNNTIITIADLSGGVLAWSSSGSHFKGNKKSTPFAASEAARVAVDNWFKSMNIDISKTSHQGNIHLIVKIHGPGPGRESAVRAISSMGFQITAIHDVTGLPHNGARPPKRRRM